ncbi:MAG: hypothetical protein VW577_06710 [Pelagibacteraceae bacterium]
MAKAKAAGSTKAQKRILNDNPRKGTSIGRGALKRSTMNKSKKRSYKKYRGQG